MVDPQLWTVLVDYNPITTIWKKLNALSSASIEVGNDAHWYPD